MKKWLKMAVTSVLALGVSALLIMSESAADDTTWIGSHSDFGDWFESDNWDEHVPESDDDAIIDNGNTVVVQDGEAEVDRLRIRNGSTLLVRSGGELITFDHIELQGGNLTLRGDGFIDTDENSKDLRHLSGDSTINLSGSSGLFVQDTEIGKVVAGGSFTVNISGSASYIITDDFDARAEDTDVTITIIESGEMDVNDEFDLRTFGTSDITVDGANTKFNLKNMTFRRGTHTLHLLNGAQSTMTGDIRLGFDGGVSTINISDDSGLSGINDLRLGAGSGSAEINMKDDSTLTVLDELVLRASPGTGTAQVNLSGNAVLTVDRMNTAFADVNDFVEICNNAQMIFTGPATDVFIEMTFIFPGFITASTCGGMITVLGGVVTPLAEGFVSSSLAVDSGITVVRVPVELGDIPDIDVESQGKTPIHLKLTDVDVSTLLIGDPDLGGVPVSPLNTNDNGNQTVIQVSTQEMVAQGVLDATTSRLLVTGNLNSGTPFWAYGDLNLPEALAAVSAVPEPASLILLGLGAVGLMFRRRR